MDMQIMNKEILLSSGLHVSMPLPGVIRVTDGNNPKSYAVCAKFRPKEPKLDGDSLVWGNISLEPEKNMALYLDGKCLCRDFEGTLLHGEPMSREELETLKGEGHLSDEDVRRLANRWSVEVVKALGPNDAIYGLGDKTGFLNKRHYAYENWNIDDPKPHCDNYRSLYKSIPFFIIMAEHGCCGILADNTYRTRFDFGKECADYLYWSHEDGALDYYMIPGKDIKQVLKKYYALTGGNPLQQKWLYGFHQSRWSYESQQEVLEVARNFRSNDLPLDAIHLDIDYMDGYRVFTKDQKRFPDMEAMHKALAEKGIHTVAIVDPGVKLEQGYGVYDEGAKKGYFAKNPDGSVYEGAVWPGAAVFPDYSKLQVRKWWGEKIACLMENGIGGIWNDMNEPANFTGQLPDNVQFSEGDHLRIHNVYGHLMAQATYEGMRKAGNLRPFVLTRACYAGSQRYCGGWTGDNHSLWAHLQLSMTQMMNLGLSGFNFVGADVGGFGSDTTPELLVRWMQLGALSPFYRNHSAKGTMPQEPYRFDKKTLDACREALRLRYRLLPYIYDLAHEELPILRPLIMEFPNDSMCRDLSDQFMLGAWLMAAPILTPGVTARAVYLPKGSWYDFYTGKRYSGGRYILADAPYDRIPLFARAGAAIPVSACDVQCTDDIDDIALWVYSGRGSFVHYTDDGKTMDYEKGCVHKLKITVTGKKVTQRVMFDGFNGPQALPVKIIE